MRDTSRAPANARARPPQRRPAGFARSMTGTEHPGSARRHQPFAGPTAAIRTAATRAVITSFSCCYPLGRSRYGLRTPVRQPVFLCIGALVANLLICRRLSCLIQTEARLATARHPPCRLTEMRHTAPLTWSDSANGLRICLMIGETTESVDCLMYLRHRR